MANWYARNVAVAGGGWNAANQTQVGGLTANASGSLGVLGGAATGTVEQPVTRYYTASVFNADGTLAVNGVRVFLINAATGQLDSSYPTGDVTINHPAGHPTQAVSDTGWMVFTKLALLADHVGMVFMVPDQGLTVGLETGVSIPVLPQVTSNGNG